MATAWADDVAAGHHTALLAWRHRDVDDLNRLARAQWDAMGQLHGEDVAVWNGRTYAVGDRLVALAPNHVAGIVTSQRLTVIDLDRFSITAATDDGRTVTLTGPGIDRSHLGYGYAVTIHRAQGATFDRAHVLGAGGGRELAYVALSRARDQTTIYATADDLEQALADFRSDWRTERHDRWITPVDAAFGRGSEAIALDRLLPTSRPDVVDGFGL
jgi:ATP-dependent exoDNAse (exonuclease V) alpha subunit